ncbi:NADH kinase Pos5p, mitochondrial [[Candida] jaroonii]|uniref:NADH kinase Pos5p, mitochondrial n=1 Tax=[Candida] jaroonii TaxID=467808 RepID=A0ACA9Y2C2_9ASCO|nr:NADH kinase Pos5p, mitochondrial [[Candida] jaroonii]
MLRFIRSLHLESASTLQERIIPRYLPNKKLYNLTWPSPPQNVYITKKPNNKEVTNSMIKFINFLNTSHPEMNIILNNQVINELNQLRLKTDLDVVEKYQFNQLDKVKIFNGDLDLIKAKTDLLITIGGDGTILNSVSQFSNSNVPPILSFSMGTLGFLLPFDFQQHMEIFNKIINNKGQVIKRSRIECHVIRQGLEEKNDRVMKHALNEITVHRGSEENMVSLDISINNELLTTTTADGIICSTPTGSTAYSLSAGGPIVHPLIEGILINLISPRSLSYRPLILPHDSEIMIRLSPKNRNIEIKLSIDGIKQPDLKMGDEIHIMKKLSIDNNIWCVSGGENDWTKDINELLGFNKSFKERPR